MDIEERGKREDEIQSLKDNLAYTLEETLARCQEMQGRIKSSAGDPGNDAGAFNVILIGDKTAYMNYQAGQLQALVKSYKAGVKTNETNDRSNKEAEGGGVGEKLVQGQDGAQDSQD